MGQPQGSTPPGENGPVEIEYVVHKKRRPLRARLAWVAFLLVWVVILFIPFAFFTLASRGQITISHSGDVPDKFEHPLLQVRLISEIDYRGLLVINSTVDRTDALNLCVQTQVRYLLWQGEGEPATYCDCYARAQSEDEWLVASSVPGRCP